MSRSRHLKRVVNRRFMEWLLCWGFLSLYSSLAIAVGFTTNFKPDVLGWGFDTTGSCNPNASTPSVCRSTTIGNGDLTPFAEAVVVINNVPYFHVVVGDLASGFAMESYTRAAGLDVNGTIPNVGPTGPPAAFSPDGGGNSTSYIGSLGDITNSTGTFFTSSLNAFNPLGAYQVSGTGSQNPSQTVFRMVLNDPLGDMSLEVDKPFLSKKPRISQTVQDGAMTSVFVTDETALSYSDSSTAAPIVNNLVINDPLIPVAGAGDFEMALAQSTNITAGRYTFTPGTGWNASPNPSLGWDQTNSQFGFGTYNYVGNVTFNPLTFDWSSVFNYADNAAGCSQTTGSTSTALTRQDHGVFNGTVNVGANSYYIGGSCFNNPFPPTSQPAP